MKTFYRNFKKDLTITDGKNTIEYKKNDRVLTSQTKKGICKVFDRFWFDCDSKYFKNVVPFTK